jgi:hypothetical protein
VSASEELINELSTVTSLKHSLGWGIIVRDAQLAHDVAGSSWVDIWDEKQLFELRVKQCAARQIITLIDQYESRLKEAQMDLIRATEQHLMVGLDVDNNPPDIEGTDDAE